MAVSRPSGWRHLSLRAAQISGAILLLPSRKNLGKCTMSRGLKFCELRNFYTLISEWWCTPGSRTQNDGAPLAAQPSGGWSSRVVLRASLGYLARLCPKGVTNQWWSPVDTGCLGKDRRWKSRRKREGRREKRRGDKGKGRKKKRWSYCFNLKESYFKLKPRDFQNSFIWKQ